MRHSRCIGTILLQTVAISVAMATMTSDVKKPFGPRLCERLCNRIAGCSSYIYRMSDLSCHVTPVMLQNQENGINIIKDTKYKERMHAENAVNCSEGDQIFRTRSYIFKCRPILPNLPTLTNKEDVTAGKMTRILMVPSSLKGSLPGRQLYLSNNSIVTYPFLDSKTTYAIAYIPSQRKLIMSIRRWCLILMPIDAKEKTVIKIRHSIIGIAIDDEKQLMFIHTRISYRGVGVMTTYGKNFTLLFRLQCSSAHMIVADSNRSLIYVLCLVILQFTYQGVPKGPMAEIENVGGYTLYMQGDILYYQTKTKNALVQASLSDHSVTTLSVEMPTIHTLLKVGDLLYMLPKRNKRDILVVNMSDMSTLTKLKTGFERYSRETIMCLIP